MNASIFDTTVEPAPHQCGRCGAGYQLAENLEQHERSCGKPDPFEVGRRRTFREDWQQDNQSWDLGTEVKR